MIKNLLRPIKRVVEKSLGLEITRVVSERKLTKAQDVPHSRVLPIATYSPWKNDTKFRNVYEMVLPNSRLVTYSGGSYLTTAGVGSVMRNLLNQLKKNGEMAAQEVEKHFYLEQSTTSHHLNTLI